ncbi:MAG: choice-of-anchor D domain-containing protein, partial [Gemmatimonadaceae bacterium]
MACLTITNGLFINAGPPWQSGSGTTPNGCTITNTPGGPNPGLSIVKGASSQFFAKPANGNLHWLQWGNPANFIAVLTISDTSGSATRTVLVVDTSAATLVVSSPLLQILAPSTASLPQLDASQVNGSVFALIASNGTQASGGLFRSVDGFAFPGGGLIPFQPSLQVLGNATATQLQILEGAVIRASTPRPNGVSKVLPNPGNFPDAVVGPGVPPALSVTTLQFHVKNTGNDCLTVTAIGNVAPYSVTATSAPLPKTLDPGQTLDVDVRFAPAATGTFNVDLPLTLNSTLGDQVLHCKGKARAPVLSVSFSGAVSFGSVPVASSATRNLVITNNGEADVTVNVAAGASGPFSWSGFGGTLAPGANTGNIPITFAPNATGAQTATIPFISSTPASPHHVNVSGTGCIPTPQIAIQVPPPGPGIDFGDIGRGFRTVRVVTVRNNGSAPLNFRATVSGSPLYGLAQAGDSVTAPQTTLSLTVNPPTTCGPLPTGTGVVTFAVTFFANASPGVVSGGQLVIDSHNAPASPPSFTVALDANVIALVNVDAELVLDRSGSMSEASGPRTKIATALDASHLFVQLFRPDVDDRLGIVSFNETPSVLASIAPVTAASQASLVSTTLTAANLTPSGSTAIAGGVLTAFNDMTAHPRAVDPPGLTRAVVVLTDGKDNTPFTNPVDGVTYTLLGENGTTPLPTPSGTRVYAVGIGDNIDTGRLGQLAQATGGTFLSVHDFNGTDFFKLEKHFTQIFMDAVDLASIVDPVYMIGAGETHVIEFDVLRGDTSSMVVIYDRDGIRLPFHLVTPGGEILDLTSVPSGFSIRPGVTRTARFLEIRHPADEPDRCAGRWQVVIHHDGRACSVDRPVTGIATQPGIITPKDFGAEFEPSRCVPFSEPIMYGIAIGVGSNFRMVPFVDPGIVRVGEAIRLNALVSEFGLPVLDSIVTVEAKAPDGTVSSYVMRDDGAHDDDDA